MIETSLKKNSSTFFDMSKNLHIVKNTRGKQWIKMQLKNPSQIKYRSHYTQKKLSVSEDFIILITALAFFFSESWVMILSP